MKKELIERVLIEEPGSEYVRHVTPESGSETAFK